MLSKPGTAAWLAILPSIRSCFSIPVVCLCLSLALSCNGQSSYPITIKDTSLEFGLLKQHTVLQKSTELINNGLETISVIGTMADCSCVTAEASPTVLTPGAKAVVTVRFDSREYRGDVTRRITIHTSKGSFVLPVRATVGLYRNWRLSDTVVAITPGKLANIVVERSDSSNPARVTGGSAHPDYVAMEISTSGTSSVIGLRNKAEVPIGMHRIVVTLNTTDPIEGTIQFDAFLEVRGPLSLPVGAVVLPLVEVGQAASATTSLSGRAPNQSLRVILEGGEASTEEGLKGGPLLIKLSIIPSKSGSTSHALKVFEDDKLLAVFPVIVRAR